MFSVSNFTIVSHSSGYLTMLAFCKPKYITPNRVHTTTVIPNVDNRKLPTMIAPIIKREPVTFCFNNNLY